MGAEPGVLCMLGKPSTSQATASASPQSILYPCSLKLRSESLYLGPCSAIFFVTLSPATGWPGCATSHSDPLSVMPKHHHTRCFLFSLPQPRLSLDLSYYRSPEYLLSPLPHSPPPPTGQCAGLMFISQKKCSWTASMWCRMHEGVIHMKITRLSLFLFSVWLSLGPLLIFVLDPVQQLCELPIISWTVSLDHRSLVLGAYSLARTLALC